MTPREILAGVTRRLFGIENPIEYRPETHAMEHVIEAQQNLADVNAIRQGLPRGAFYTQDFLAAQVSKGGGTGGLKENLQKWNPEQGRVSQLLWQTGQDTANSAKFQAASTAVPISREAKIVLEASEFAKQFGIGIVRETGKVGYTAGAIGEKTISLGQDFFSDEIAKNPDAIFEYGRQTPERLRKLIMAHEVGHALATPHTELAMGEVIAGQPLGQQQKMLDYIASAKKGLTSWQMPEVEMAADVIAYGLGYRFPRQTELWGLSDEQLDNLSTEAIKDALEFGKLTESQAKILMSHLGEEVRVDRIARRPSPEEEANRAFWEAGGEKGAYEETEPDLRTWQRLAEMPRAAGTVEGVGADYMAGQRPSVLPRAETGAGTAYTDEGRGISHARDMWEEQRMATIPSGWKDTARELAGGYSLATVEAKRFTWGQQQTTPAGTRFINEATGEMVFSEQETSSIVNRAAGDFAKVTSGAFREAGTPTELLATVVQRTIAVAKEYFNTAFKGAGADFARTGGVEWAKELYTSVTKDLTDSLKATFTEGGQVVGSFRAMGPRAVYLGTDAERITSYLGQNADYDRIIGELGGPAAAAGGPPNLFEAGGIPFNVGGQGGGYGGRGRSLWGAMGQMGQGLYAAYLARRFWMMTGAPVGQEMTAYEQMQGIIEPMAGAQNMMFTAGGAPQMAAAFTQWAGQGAYQQFGGAMQGVQALAMDTGNVGARLWATARTAAGVGIAGSLLAGPMGQMMGIPEAMRPALPKVGMGIMAAITGAGIGVEITNALGPTLYGGEWQGDTGLGDIPKIFAQLGVNILMGENMTDTYAQNAAKRMLQDPNSYTRSWLLGAEKMPGAVELTKASQVLSLQTGETQDVSSTIMTRLARMSGITAGAPLGSIPQLAKEAIQQAQQAGVAAPSFQAQQQAYAEGLGLLPGTAAFGTGMAQYTGMDTTQRYLADQRNAVNARYAGEISPYFSNQMDAVNFAWQRNLTTQGATAPYQSLMGAINTGYGVDFSNQANATYAGNLAQQYGPQAGGVPGQIVSTMAMAAPSMPWQQAAGMYGQYNMNPVSAQGYLQAVNQAQQFRDLLTPQQANQLAGYTTGLPNAYQRDLAQQMAGGLAANMGIPYTQAMGMLPSNATDWQMGMLQRMQGGDISAISYMARMGNNPAGQWLNEAGQPIYTTNMPGFLQMGAANNWPGFGGINLPPQGILPTATYNAATAGAVQQWLGGQGVNISGGLANALAQGGTIGAAQYQSQQQLGFTLASIGVGYQGIAAQEKYLWGGGTPTAPGAGSAWAMEDQMRAMQYQQQMAQFAYSFQRMDTAQGFQVQQERITGERMGVVQGYQRWQMGFEQQGNLQQRQWTQQDWAYNEQMRTQQFGWQMEDIDLAIRQSSGRERQQLVKQEGRMAETYETESGHIDDVKKRQEELWSREDERYNKTKAYSEHLMTLDKQSFDLNQKQRETFYKMDRDHLGTQLKEYQDQKKLQDEIIAHQREYQVEQLKLQKQSLGIQAAAAISANTYQQAILEIERSYATQLGIEQEMMRNDPSYMLKKTSEFYKDVNATDPNKITALKDAVKSFNVLDGSKTGLLVSMNNSFNNLNSEKLHLLINLFQVIGGLP
jgi:hypothetical protein